jgi:YD repeat-containing protein
MNEPSGSEPANSSLPGELRGPKEELLDEMREFARTLRELEGEVPTAEMPGARVELPKVVRDRRGRAVEVWDRLGRRTFFFYHKESAQPYAYQVCDREGLAVEQGSTIGSGRHWVVYRDYQGLKDAPAPEHVLPHAIARVEVTEDGAMLASAGDGYQLRRDTSGADFEAFYDATGCLTEAVRRDERGVQRTTWQQRPDGTSVATEMRPDGSVVASTYDEWGRLISRSANVHGSQTRVAVSYEEDGTHLVTREDKDGRVVETWRRRDGTLSQSRTTGAGGEVVERSYDAHERLVREERRADALLQLTTWRYGEDGWTEVSQSNNQGLSLKARYDAWGRLVFQQESGPSGSRTLSYVYKGDGSYRITKKSSDGMQVEEYYRADGRKHYSKVTYPDGRVAEIDHERTSPV